MLNYQETIDYLFHRLPMFSRIGAAAYNGDLTNTIRLCEAIGNPQNTFKSIHIAGTNGKGSTSHMLAAIMQTAGYKTGLYTSPHLKDFRERMKINGSMVDEEFVIQFTERIKPSITAIDPSFFEITVAMAFSWFAAQQVDIAIIEVGLGGRLDSTNIITPELSVITNIGYDHMNLLGETLEKIAGEKAGIIKPRIPVVIGETLPETKPVFEEKTRQMNAPLVYASAARWVADWTHTDRLLQVTIADSKTDERKQYKLDLPGLYQIKNLLTVLEAVHQMVSKNWRVEEKHIEQALLHTRKLTGLHGRWEVIHERPYLVLDVGHNQDGISQITAQLTHGNFKKLHIVIGMVKDKDIATVLSLLPTYASYYFTSAQIPRALPATELMVQAADFGLKGHAYDTTMKAVQQAVDDSQQDDMILVCGSVFIVGEVDAEQIKW